ncbi:MAG: DUF354 domain-containing protein [Ignavibacteriaceae bacterium]
MRILIDVGHPAHFHLFKNFAMEMWKKGNELLFTCREKEFEKQLLNKYGFEYTSFGKKYSSKAGKLYGLFKFDLQEIVQGFKFKPDLFLSHGSMYAAHAAFLLRKPHIAFEDTGNWEQVKLYKSFTSVILTSDIFSGDYGNKQIRYNAHHELAYLNPKYFAPDISIYEHLKIKRDQKYALLRFVSWNATHDIGHKGLTIFEKTELINYLNSKMKVFISSESELPAELKKYKVSISPELIHSVLYYSELFVGEGTTMAMEAAVLGTPAFYVNPLQYSNCVDMEKYNLLFSFTSSSGLIDTINSVLKIPDLKAEWQKRRNIMLADKIDVTAFLVWFVENYPESVKVMKENPDYQFNFK